MLPPYIVKRSVRAKYPRVVIDSKSGTPVLYVVLPKWDDESSVPSYIEEKKDWIMRQWAVFTERSEQRRATMEMKEVNLRAVDEVWKIERDESVEPLRLEWDDGMLIISPKTERAAAVKLIRTWLGTKAKFHLMPSLWRLADELGFNELQGVRISCQKTIWGSCANDGIIRLNCKLLFFPPQIVKHVLIHELCHLREMSHSKRFHKMLSHFDKNSKDNALILRNKWAYVPGWIEPV